ncbi:hypothetical protein CB0940_03901 [Cercospora beticola]|uniref:Uncharacterized protein n=1 Tax=Cercospora beticola TaxID=122368 RepID=A0A2G5HMQ3_CERBT|nr:hypothetical protein CB0940_03901 [Cercospora beticola]PIA93492.1 hypothetical protein CB0940_03901 [Cercospora beticola]WPB01103.1 hypothetical protein RHO25_005724 [Cercospora beticola]CAK1364153.1 unnamed protein product [Cercospora beticola]
MARLTVRARKTRATTLLLLVACIVILLIATHSKHTSDGDLDRQPSPFDATKQLSSRLLPRVDDEDEKWLGFPKDELATRTSSSLGAKGKLAKEGWAMLCRMRDPPGSTTIPATPYTEYSDLEKYGYVDEITRDSYYPAEEVEEEQLAALGLSEGPKNWKESHVRQIDSTPQYPATGATYQNVLNVKEGAIVAVDNDGPDWFNKEHGLGLKPEQIVPLKHWSDIIWLAYDHQAKRARNANAAPLEHVIRHQVETPEVQRQLQLITGKAHPDELGAFPGVSYAVDSAQGMAVLGTIHGKGVAWLLAQHKDSLGWRAIDRVHVYNCHPHQLPLWCVYLHISEVRR